MDFETPESVVESNFTSNRRIADEKIRQLQNIHWTHRDRVLSAANGLLSTMRFGEVAIARGAALAIHLNNALQGGVLTHRILTVNGEQVKFDDRDIEIADLDLILPTEGWEKASNYIADKTYIDKTPPEDSKHGMRSDHHKAFSYTGLGRSIQIELMCGFTTSDGEGNTHTYYIDSDTFGSITHTKDPTRDKAIKIKIINPTAIAQSYKDQERWLRINDPHNEKAIHKAHRRYLLARWLVENTREEPKDIQSADF